MTHYCHNCGPMVLSRSWGRFCLVHGELSEPLTEDQILRFRAEAEISGREEPRFLRRRPGEGIAKSWERSGTEDMTVRISEATRPIGPAQWAAFKAKHAAVVAALEAQEAARTREEAERARIAGKFLVRHVAAAEVHPWRVMVAQWAAAVAAADLGSRRPRIEWFESIGEWSYMAAWKEGRAAAAAVEAFAFEPFAGLARRGTAHIDATMELDETALVVFHEVRHLAQPGDLSPDEAERDAAAYQERMAPLVQAKLHRGNWLQELTWADMRRKS